MASTLDPSQIQDPSHIPPPGAHHVGISPGASADVYCGTLVGDIDASPSAQELLSPSPDTGGQSNADYVYDQVSKLYGGIQLPEIAGSANSVVLVSGSGQRGYGAFHMGNTQADLDRIVVDSRTTSGSYSSSGLGAAMAPPSE